MVPSAPDERLLQRSWRRFETGYRMRPPVTTALVVAFLVCHLISGGVDYAIGETDAWGVVFGARSSRGLALCGGRVAVLVAHGEIWRLWTYGFLHADALHIFFNTTAMWGLGRVCEAVYGSTRTLWLFLLAVLGGGILSQAGGTMASVGASGGIFGLMGALLVFGQKRRRSMDREMRATFGRRLAPWVLLNLFIGVLLPFIDNLGHVGGLVAGAAFGLVSGDTITADNDVSRVSIVAMRLGSAALLVVGLLAVILPALGR